MGTRYHFHSVKGHYCIPLRKGGIFYSLPSNLLEPALHNNLGIGKETNRILALGMEDAEERVFSPAEGEESDSRGNADVDSNAAALNIILELAGGFAAGGKDGMTIAEVASVTDFDRFIQGFRG